MWRIGIFVGEKEGSVSNALTPSDLSSTTGRLGHDPRLGAPAPNGTHTHASPHQSAPPTPHPKDLDYFFPFKSTHKEGLVWKL